MFTFSFGSAFAANPQTGVYDKQDRTDELYYPAAYQANVSETEFGEYGITEAYKAELVKTWGKVLKDKTQAADDKLTQAKNDFNINATNYYAVEKAEAKELITAAIESFKTATTAADARKAEKNLVKMCIRDRVRMMPDGSIRFNVSMSMVYGCTSQYT